MALVNGVDVSQFSWDQLAASFGGEVAPGTGGDAGTAYSSLLGTSAQKYGNQISKGGGFTFNKFGSGPQTETLFNLSDSNSPSDHLTQLYRTDDNKVGVRYYEKKDTFVQDMAMFAAAATGIYGGINALANYTAQAALETAAENVVTESGGSATVSGVSDLAGTSASLPAPAVETASSLSLAEVAAGVKSGASVIGTGASLYSLSQKIDATNSPRPTIPVRVSPRPSGSGFTNQYYSPSELANMAADQETASQRIAPQSPVRQTSAAMPTQIAGIPINKIIIGVAVVAVAYVIFKHGKVAAPAA